MARFVVTSPGLHVRPRPDADNTPLGEVPRDGVVEKLGESGKWFFVKIAVRADNFIGDLYGWMSSAKLAPAAPAAAPEPPPSAEPAPHPPPTPPPLQGLPSEPFSIDSNLKTRPSPLTAALIDKYLRQQKSPLAGLGQAVMAAARKYGINATYILAHAIHESDWGRSRICRDKHNLFGWGAKDEDAYNSAWEFSSPADCIDVVMGRVDKIYLTDAGAYFASSPCLGKKRNGRGYGMSVHYASDNRWAEKIVTHARNIESWAASHAGLPGDAQPDSTPLSASPDAQRLLDAVARVNPEQPYYQKRDITGDNQPETFCNWFVADVLDSLGIELPRYDASAGYYPMPHPLYGYEHKEKPYMATQLHQYFKKGGAGHWQEVERTAAVAHANRGAVVVASIPGHVGLVIPGGEGDHVRIAQAGRVCGRDLRLAEGFGDAAVRFFRYTG